MSKCSARHRVFATAGPDRHSNCRMAPSQSRGAYIINRSVFILDGFSLTSNPAKPDLKAKIDALLLTLPGVTAKKISDLDAYLISGRMFACISGDGVGLRLPAVTATELQFSRDNVVPFRPRGIASTREWIQINCEVMAEYEKDLPLFLASLEFVKASRAG